MKLTHETLIMGNPQQILLPRFTVSQIMRNDQQVSFRIFFTANHYTFTADDYLVVKYAQIGPSGLPLTNRSKKIKYFKPPTHPRVRPQKQDNLIFGHLIYKIDTREYDIEWEEADVIPAGENQLIRKVENTPVPKHEEPKLPPTKTQRILDGISPSDKILAEDMLDSRAKDPAVRRRKRKRKEKTAKEQLDANKVLATVIPTEVEIINEKNRNSAMAESMNQALLNHVTTTPMSTFVIEATGATSIPIDLTDKEKAQGITLDGKTAYGLPRLVVNNEQPLQEDEELIPNAEVDPNEEAVPNEEAAPNEEAVLNEEAVPNEEVVPNVDVEHESDENLEPLIREQVWANRRADEYVDHLGAVLMQNNRANDENDENNADISISFRTKVLQHCGKDPQPEEKVAAALEIVGRELWKTIFDDTATFLTADYSVDSHLGSEGENDYRNCHYYPSYNPLSRFIVGKKGAHRQAKGIGPVIDDYIELPEDQIKPSRLQEIQAFIANGLLAKAYNRPPQSAEVLFDDERRVYRIKASNQLHVDALENVTVVNKSTNHTIIEGSEKSDSIGDETRSEDRSSESTVISMFDDNIVTHDEAKARILLNANMTVNGMNGILENSYSSEFSDDSLTGVTNFPEYGSSSGDDDINQFSSSSEDNHQVQQPDNGQRFRQVYMTSAVPKEIEEVTTDDVGGMEVDEIDGDMNENGNDGMNENGEDDLGDVGDHQEPDNPQPAPPVNNDNELDVDTPGVNPGRPGRPGRPNNEGPNNEGPNHADPDLNPNPNINYPIYSPFTPAYLRRNRRPLSPKPHLRPFRNHFQPGYDPVTKDLVWKIRIGIDGFRDTFVDYVKLFTKDILDRVEQEVVMASNGKAGDVKKEIIDELTMECQQRLYFRSNPGYVYCYWNHCSPRLRRLLQAPYFFRNHHSRHLYWYLICGTANSTELREDSYRILIGRHAFIGRAEEVIVCSYTPITIPGNSFFNPMWIEVRDENDELYPLQMPYIVEWTFMPRSST